MVGGLEGILEELKGEMPEDAEVRSQAIGMYFQFISGTTRFYDLKLLQLRRLSMFGANLINHSSNGELTEEILENVFNLNIAGTEKSRYDPLVSSDENLSVRLQADFMFNSYITAITIYKRTTDFDWLKVAYERAERAAELREAHDMEDAVELHSIAADAAAEAFRVTEDSYQKKRWAKKGLELFDKYLGFHKSNPTSDKSNYREILKRRVLLQGALREASRQYKRLGR